MVILLNLMNTARTSIEFISADLGPFSTHAQIKTLIGVTVHYPVLA